MKRLNKASKTFIIALLAATVAGSYSSAFAAGADQPLQDSASLAGSGQFGEKNGAAEAAEFRNPQGIVILKDGSLLVADTMNHLIRQLKNGQVSTFAGVTIETNHLGLPQGGLVDDVAAKSFFQSPADIAVDGAGNLYIADSENNVIRKIDTAGKVSVLAGDAVGAPGNTDGRGSEAMFNHPTDLVVTSSGVVYVADTLNHVIRKISTTGQVTTLNAASQRAVEISSGQVEAAGDFKDGKLAEAYFNEPSGLALDAKGNLYVSDSGNQRIRYIDFVSGTVSTVAGSKQALAAKNELYAVGDYVDGAADEAKFDFPKGLALTAEGGLLIADSSNNAIRYLNGDKVITFVGTPDAEFGDIDGTETTARLHHPTDVEVASNGDIYIADAYNNKIRKLTSYKLPVSLKKDGAIHVVSGSKEVVFDAKPQVVNNRAMVPISAIAVSLGYEVKWTDNGHVILSSGDSKIELTIGSATVKSTVGTATSTSKLDAAPFVEGDRTYVPVRFLSEQLSKQVDWNQEYRTVIIR